jgi:hypothetical protein
MIRRIKRYRDKILRILKQKKTQRRALAFAARWRLPWFAALILVAMSRPLLVKAGAPPGASSRRILVLNFGKDEFFRDIQEIFRGDTTFELVSWPHNALSAVAEVLLDQSLRHNTYLTNDPAIEATKTRYRRFLQSMWRYHQLLRPICAVISANFGYCIQREFATALEMRGTPFLVVQKENLNAATEERRRIWHAIYKNGRGKFGGRKILVYNEMEHDLEVTSGVASPERVEIVGMPRLDRLHRWRHEHPDSVIGVGAAKILFFSFSRSDKIPRSFDLAKDWGQFCADTHRAMIELAHCQPEVDVIAKTKGIGRQNEELFQVLDSIAKEQPHNLRIVSGGDAFQLLTESRVVVGFNTTGLIEALAIGKPVIVPRFGEANDPQLRKLIIDLGDAVEYANSPQQLQELVSMYASRPDAPQLDLTPNVQRILRYWVGNDDGQAGRRAYNAIRHEIMPS